MIAEINRHAGIVRELIDGATGLRADGSNRPDSRTDKRAEYREKLEQIARAAGSVQS